MSRTIPELPSAPSVHFISEDAGKSSQGALLGHIRQDTARDEYRASAIHIERFSMCTAYFAVVNFEPT
ncbi:MAG: hypothetical protein MI923_05575 [Phycisphaerales bacterium]|nr:hypothetical protein [Phycisphaerales bacterium]